MAGVAERARHRLRRPFFVDRAATERIFAGGNARQESSPMDLGQTHWPAFRTSSFGMETEGAGRNLSLWQIAPLLWRWQNLGILPRRRGKTAIVVSLFSGSRLNGHLHFGQSGNPGLCVTSDRNRFASLNLPRNGNGGRKGFERSVDIIVAVRVGIVGVEKICEDEVRQPFHRFKTVGFRDDHANGAATLAVEPASVQLIT